MEKKLKNGSILLAPHMRHILASLDSVASAADGIQKEALNQVASVGIRTQTLASSLDQLVCLGDLTHQPKLVRQTTRPSKS